MTAPFDLLDPTDRGPDRGKLLGARKIPATLGNHREAAKHYQPDPELVDAINVALAVGAPLLLTGEPGTGKTQVAYYLAWYFRLTDNVFELPVRSGTCAEDLLYTFDAVAYLHAAQDPALRGQKIEKADHVRPGPLWRAYKAEGPSVVLIDEIDKAPRDFPNDLLHVLDQHTFTVRETDKTIRPHDGAAPPVIIITSNSERRLPEPFLRRCVFHHIEFNDELVRRAVDARLGDFPELSDAVREAAIKKFLDLRQKGLRKPPATAELLVWLAVLSARKTTLDEFERGPLEFPALSALVKDREDRERLR